MLNELIAVQVSPPHASLSDHVIMLGESFIKKHKLQVNKSISLRFGATKTLIKIVKIPRLDGLRISSGLARKINLHDGFKVRMQYRASGPSLQLGPVLAVMVNQVRRQRPDRPFGNNTAFCKELVDACQSEGIIVYFLSPDMLRTSGTVLEGWTYHNGWRMLTFPFPNVVYNRLTSRILENKSHVQQFMKAVKSRYNTKIFNERYLHKNEVFKVLKKVPALRKYLPESHALTGFPILNAMCRRHRTVFLKPILGSLGKGIMRITRQPDGKLICQSTHMKGSTSQIYSSTAKLYAAIAGKMKVRRYQIQQGLKLIAIGSKPIDFRALVQKNRESRWEVTSIVARIAGNHHFVSNLARGGTLSTVSEALSRARGVPIKATNAKLRKAAVDIAQGIEAQIPQNFGELGVDLAVDTRGKVWLIEVNSKPSKNDNTPLNPESNSNTIRPSVNKATKYIRHLAGF